MTPDMAGSLDRRSLGTSDPDLDFMDGCIQNPKTLM